MSLQLLVFANIALLLFPFIGRMRIIIYIKKVWGKGEKGTGKVWERYDFRGREDGARVYSLTLNVKSTTMNIKSLTLNVKSTTVI